MKKYKHLFFDLDNTLYDFNGNSYLALEKAFAHFELHKDLPSFREYFEVYTEINDFLWGEYREQRMAKDMLRGKRHIDSLAKFGIKPVLAGTEIDDRYLYEMTLQTELFPDTIKVLGELKKRGYFIHIITNGFKEVQDHKLVNTGLDKYVNDVYISEVIKAPKPAREIFEHAIKSSNARKTESIMIGDSWESDMVGAKRFGIDQVYYELPGSRLDLAEGEQPTYSIKNLKELLELFK